ncbi:starch synthase [Chloropicon primus]|uniref:starch synthase n=1 Tax=Chloropicon primus TaxID=1764295 RepID=A0A5B8MXH5_9CHLO|nr:starch synthase [Chloropicon primus]UPR03388.1 starch synthase [Chloropicon primus]|eukprot:QDZ24180.1 starch synthase [Chloropicon primus]
MKLGHVPRRSVCCVSGASTSSSPREPRAFAPTSRARRRRETPREVRANSSSVVLESEPVEPERTRLSGRVSREELEGQIREAQTELKVLFEQKPPPKASVVAEHRNKLSSLETRLRELDTQIVEEAKVKELKQLQREQQALQKAVISSSMKSSQGGSKLEAGDVAKMATAVEEENAALREILAIRREEAARRQETTQMECLELENKRLHGQLEAMLSREKALLELRHQHNQTSVIVTDEEVSEALRMQEQAESEERGVEAPPPRAEAITVEPVVAEEQERDEEEQEESGGDDLVNQELVGLVAEYSKSGAIAEVIRDFEERMDRYAKFTEERMAMVNGDKGPEKNDLVRARISEVREATMQNVSKEMEGDSLFVKQAAKPGKSVKVFYRAKAGPLADCEDLTLHWGYNAWSAKGFAVELQGDEKEEGCHSATLDVPGDALVLDFVVESSGRYDNNLGLDYHVTVEREEGIDKFWEMLVEKEREAERKAEEDKVSRLGKRKEASDNERAEKQARKLYTSSAVQAGEMATLFYHLCESDSVEVGISFNRSSHAVKLPQVPMLRIGEGKFAVSFLVPEDAFLIDAKFYSHNTCDDRNGFGYHIPVQGSLVQESPQHICHVAVEMAPIAKVGGLGDVVTSIGRAVQDMGHQVEVVLPKYDTINYDEIQGFHEIESFEWGGCTNRVFTGIVENVVVNFIDPSNGMFSIGMIYGADYEPIPMMDSERFGFFSKAALEFLLQSGRQPDIVHCHDWSTGLTAKSYWDDYHNFGLSTPKIVFTIHNFGYGEAEIGAAAMFSQKFTTVSPSYADEIRHEHCIAPYSDKFVGILNGIDPAMWDPMDDEFLPIPYSEDNAAEGKARAKAALRERVGLRNDDVPVVGIVSRLTQQKGVHLMEHAIWTALERGCQCVVLGSAFDPEMQRHWDQLELSLRHQYHDAAKLIFAYDEPLSHLIYAGCDMILVPSMFEPCGLTQMIAMRYGAVPVVRQTGGLRDTVFDVDHDRERADREKGIEPNGFTFEGMDTPGMDYALNRAIDCWYSDREFFHQLQSRVMAQDWSWNEPALEYLDLYYAAKNMK